MTDRNFEAEFQDLVKAFTSARQQVIEANAGDMTDARPSTDTAKQQWRIVKERIIDLLEDWDDVVPPKRQAP